MTPVALTMIFFRRRKFMGNNLSGDAALQMIPVVTFKGGIKSAYKLWIVDAEPA
jgi:hypothetical protein